MSKNIKWFDRKFAFDFPETAYPGLVKRLKETAEQLETLTGNLPEETLVRRHENSWSIKEIAGHLLTCESLFMGRLEDYENRLATLRPADLSNKETSEANYNQMTIGTILIKFKQQRNLLIKRLEKLVPEDFGRTALHPRLKKPMRICDNCFFQAEHDDHHLAGIKELIDM